MFHPVLDRGGLAAEPQHGSAENVGYFHKVGDILPPETLNRFDDLEPVANHEAERLAHVRDEPERLLPHAVPNPHKGLCQGKRIVILLHEGPVARLHIQHQRINALRELFTHNASRNERNRLDRCGHIAQSVHLLVGRCNLPGLANQHKPGLPDNSLVLIDGEVGPETGNGFQLVQGPARVAQTPSGYHRNRDTACGHHRGKNQRHFVAHAAGGMLVHFDSGDVREVDNLTRVQHHIGECGRLLPVHAPEIHSHQERGHLIIGDRSGNVLRDELLELLLGERRTFALLPDQFNRVHTMASRSGKLEITKSGPYGRSSFSGNEP